MYWYDCILGKVLRMNRILGDYIWVILLEAEQEDCVGYCIYTGLFSPLFTCKWFYPILNKPKQSCDYDRFFEKFHLILNSPADNKNKRGKIKTGVNIFLYTVLHVYLISLQGAWGTCSVPMSSTKHRVTPSSPKTAPSSRTAWTTWTGNQAMTETDQPRITADPSFCPTWQIWNTTCQRKWPR